MALVYHEPSWANADPSNSGEVRSAITCLAMSCWNHRFKMETLTIVNGIVVQYELGIYLWWKSKVLRKRQWKNSPRTRNTEIRLGLPHAIFLHLDIGGSGVDCALAIVMSSDECSHLLELGSPGKTPSSSQGLTCAGSDLHLSDLKLLRLWNLKAFLYLRWTICYA